MKTPPGSLHNALRSALIGFGVVLLAPFWMLAQLDRTDSLFSAFSELLSLVPGKLGVFLRRSFYRMTLDACANDVHIGFGTTLAHPQVRIGSGVYVGNRCTLGLCELSDNVTIGSNVDLLSGRRQHFFEADSPVQQQGGIFTAVRIGGNAWLGNSSVVMADVGANAVVGAGSVVVHAVPAGAVVAGNPAQIKRSRETA